MNAFRKYLRAGMHRLLALAVLVPLCAAPLRADEEHLDRQLEKYGKVINEKLRARYLKGGKETVNVGVLKFLSQRGKDGRLMDNAGTINLALADRLQIALVLANPDDKLGVIDHASEIVSASGNKRANHQTAKGRTALFEIDAKSPKYPLAWGERKVKADVFLTGVITFSSDFTKVTVAVQGFDRTGNDPEEYCTFTAWADPRTLHEASESFVIPRGARGLGAETPFKPKEKLALAAQARKVFVEPAAPEEMKQMWQSPVQVQVLYDGAAVPITWEQGVGWRVPTPREGQKIAFRLRNTTEKRVGVVLAVNGESTIYRAALGDPVQMDKWILPPGGDSITIDGFQKDDDSSEGFHVLSPEDSEKEHGKYGQHAGTFSFSVFLEAQGEKPSEGSATEDEKRISSIARGIIVGEKGRKPARQPSMSDLQSLLVGSGSGSHPKGLVIPGAETNSKIKQVKFEPDPNSGVRGTIFYYKPGVE